MLFSPGSELRFTKGYLPILCNELNDLAFTKTTHARITINVDPKLEK